MPVTVVNGVTARRVLGASAARGHEGEHHRHRGETSPECRGRGVVAAGLEVEVFHHAVLPSSKGSLEREPNVSSELGEMVPSGGLLASQRFGDDEHADARA
jgi:hypothetical protein